MKRAAIVALAVVLVGGFLWLRAFPRAPAGYHWPQHTSWGGGPDALGIGVLIERDGCIYLVSETGVEQGLLVWPPFATLAKKGDDLLIGIDGRTLSIGDSVSFGGGWYETDSLAGIMSTASEVPCDGPPYFLVVGLADPA